MTTSDNKAPLGTEQNGLSEDTIINKVFGGRLLTPMYLSTELIQLSNSREPSHRLSDDKVEELYDAVEDIFGLKLDENMNEANVAEFIIFPILRLFGWENYKKEHYLSYGGRELGSFVDALLFMDKATEKEVNAELILENKRPSVPLDDKDDNNFSAPAMQILGYLRTMSLTSNTQWGILTNGKEWRLYYQNARSVAEEFFSVHLDELFDLESREERLACFKIFLLMFAKQSFKPAGLESKNFHRFALEDVKLHQEGITEGMAKKIFSETYGKLAEAIVSQAKNATSEEIRISTLKFLFRILFIMFAEDRELLPINETGYKTVSLRHKVRNGINKNQPSHNTFAYWVTIQDLCRIINNGDPSYKIPKYNGGLFKDDETPLLTNISINDKDLIKIIRPLSHLGKTYINYKNLNVEQLGSIYEKLLERAIVSQEGESEVVISKYDKKKTGSYYTPQELVNLAMDEAVNPLYDKHLRVFDKAVVEIDNGKNIDEIIKELTEIDPAKMILSQKVCDPSMGSGHFLVSLTDRLTDHVISAMEQAEQLGKEWSYKSPVRQQIENIRIKINNNLKESHDDSKAYLKDRHIVKRIVLKKCIYGVDKNPMAVELTKLALWLHTFTVGAPLSFLDHHLKCGDSLFGMNLENLKEKIEEFGGLFIWEDIKKLINETSESMKEIGNLSDAEISEVEISESIYKETQDKLNSMKKVLSFIHSIDWFFDEDDKKANDEIKIIISKFMDGQFGDPLAVLDNSEIIPENAKKRKSFLDLIKIADPLSREGDFFHWQIEFPEVWQFNNGAAKGGFDVVIGNPPWNRVKLQEIKWFADRDLSIAREPKQNQRKEAIKKLKTRNPSLYKKYEYAKWLAKASSNVLRNTGIYEELNKGDIDIYKIFLERSRQIVSKSGYVSLVLPSGIAYGKHTSSFLEKILDDRNLISFYDFENGRTRYNREQPSEYKLKPFFKEVHNSFKFCILTSTKFSNDGNVKYSAFIQNVSDIYDQNRCFYLTAEDFNLVNPNTGTAPVFISVRDKDLINSIYKQYPILARSSSSKKSVNYSSWKIKTFPVFHATNKSKLFNSEKDLKKLGSYPIDNNCYGSAGNEIYLPLYKGAMMDLHDHRAASIILNPNNSSRPQQSKLTTAEEHSNPDYIPKPFYWVLESEMGADIQQGWVVAFRCTTASTNERAFLSCILPRAAYDNTLTVIINENNDKQEFLLHANFSSIPFDYITRNKIHSTGLNWFIVQQLPVIDIGVYDEHKFGDKTAGELIKEIILELNYTAYGLKAFAEDLGYEGEPFAWDKCRRLSLMAKLDAIYFILYGITEDSDIEYIYSTFPITKEEQEKAFGTYKTRKLCVDYKNALINGKSDLIY